MSNGINDTGKSMVAFTLGVIAGGVAALLLAPASGEETRRRLGGVAAKVSDRARQGLADAKDFIGDQKDRLGVAVDAGRQAYRRESAAGMPVSTGRPDGI